LERSDLSELSFASRRLPAALRRLERHIPSPHTRLRREMEPGVYRPRMRPCV